MAKKIQDLKFDDHNFNDHTAEGMALLEKSIKQNGFGRSVLVDKDDNILSGNGVVESAINAGKTKIKVVETTGDELVVVKRTDLDINTKEGRDMALADNVTAHLNLAWNKKELEYARETWNVDVDDWGGANRERGEEHCEEANRDFVRTEIRRRILHARKEAVVNSRQMRRPRKIQRKVKSTRRIQSNEKAKRYS